MLSCSCFSRTWIGGSRFGRLLSWRLALPGLHTWQFDVQGLSYLPTPISFILFLKTGMLGMLRRLSQDCIVAISCLQAVRVFHEPSALGVDVPGTIVPCQCCSIFWCNGFAQTMLSETFLQKQKICIKSRQAKHGRNASILYVNPYVLVPFACLCGCKICFA